MEKDYGNNEDFKRLIQEAHKRGMVVIIDMVLNHTSDQNPWFIDAAIPGSEHESWYIWSNEDPGFKSPWDSTVWHKPQPVDAPFRTYHNLTSYYYALFSPGQPDLNYRNGAVTEEMFDILKYWLVDMGADGFRLDAVRHLVEDGSVQQNTAETHAWLKNFYDYVHTVSPQALTVGEIWDDTANVLPYIGDEVDIAFEFRLAEAIIKSLNTGDSTGLQKQLQTMLGVYQEGQFATFLTNHDQARLLTQLEGNIDRAKLAAILLLTHPGVPFIYYGEEIGMVGPLPDINVRKPMQWAATQSAGFTSGTPWIDPGPNAATNNVASESDDPASLLELYRSMIHLRQAHPALLSGDTWLVSSTDPAIYSLMRSTKDEALLVIANLSGEALSGFQLSLPEGPLAGEVSIEVLLGSGQPGALVVNSGGGFDGYSALPDLPAYSALILRITAK